MTDDKRQGPRSFAIMEVTFDHVGSVFRGRINDLSMGGLYIDTVNPLPAGSTISFQFSLPAEEDEEPGNPVSGEGCVVWSVHMQGMGIGFTRLSAEDRDRIKTYLSRE